MKSQVRLCNGINTIGNDDRIDSIRTRRQSGHIAADGSHRMRSTPNRRDKWPEKAEQTIRLLRYTPWHIAQMHRQHIGNSSEDRGGQRHRTRGDGKVGVDNVWTPPACLSDDWQKAGRDIESHLGYRARVLAPAKGLGAQDFDTITRLPPWKMAHPGGNDAYLVTANRQPCRDPRSDSSSSSADRRVLVTEEKNLHLVTSCAPILASHSP